MVLSDNFFYDFLYPVVLNDYQHGILSGIKEN